MYIPTKSPKIIKTELRKIKFNDKIMLTREIGIPYVIVPPVVDKKLGIDWGGDNVWFLDFVIGTLLADINFDREWENKENWRDYFDAQKNGADGDVLKNIVEQTGIRLEIESEYEFIPLFEYERKIYDALIKFPKDFKNFSFGSDITDYEGKKTRVGWCSIVYKNKIIRGMHPLLNFESNLGKILRLHSAIDALCWYKVAKQIWSDSK